MPNLPNMPAPFIPSGLCFPPGQPGFLLAPPPGMAVAAADYTGFTENQQIEFRNALNEHMLLITSIDGQPVPERYPLLWMRAVRQNQMVSEWNPRTDIGFKLSLCPPLLWRPIMNALLSRWWVEDRAKRQHEHCIAMQQQEQMQQQQMLKQEQMPQQQMLQMTQMPHTQRMQQMQQQQPGAYMPAPQPQMVSFDSTQPLLLDGFNPPMEQLQMPGGSPQPQYSWTGGVQDIQGANWESAGTSLPAAVPPLEDYALVQSVSVSSESDPGAHMAAAPVAVSTTIDPAMVSIEPEVPTMGPVSTDVELEVDFIDPILLEIDSFNWST